LSEKITKEEHKSKFFSNYLIVGLIITLIGIVIRIYFFPYNIPITLDGLLYFWYAIDASSLGKIPIEYSFPNNFWPLSLSLIFSISNLENYLELMNLQRISTIIISVLTFVPVYYILRKFFVQKYAITGMALFAVEPRLIINSLAGLPEALFVFLGSITLVLFLSNKLKIIYISFIICAIFSLVRYEGILLLIPLVITFVIRFRKEKKVIFHLLIALTIFALTILPMSYLRMEATGNDGIYSHIVGTGSSGAVNVVLSGNQDKVNFDSGILIFIKLLLWSTFPIFFLFLPYGIKSIIKKDHKNLLLVLTTIIFLIPTLYIGIRGSSETKYLLVLYPIFTLLSIFMIQKINEKIARKNLFLITVIIIAVLSSIIFLTYQINNEHEREAVIISEEITIRTTVINDYHPESAYLRTVGFLENDDYAGKYDSIQTKIDILQTNEHSTLKDFLNYAQNKKLEFLIVDNNENRSEFIKAVFKNEEKYPFLEKEFDSNDLGFKYKAKIFKINYEQFNENNN
jgi:hypothetical protein